MITEHVISEDIPTVTDTEMVDTHLSTDDLLTDTEIERIAVIANELRPDSDPSEVIELLSTLPGSGIELALALRDRYQSGDSTPFYALGTLLEQVAQAKQ